MITRIQEKSTNDTNNISSISVTLNITPIMGNVLLALAALKHNSNSSVTVSSIAQVGVSWSLLKQQTRGATGLFIDIEIWIGAVVSPTASPTLTANFSASAANGAILFALEYSGLSSLLDQSASVSAGAAVSLLSGTTPATTVAVELWLGGHLTVSNSTFSNPTNGFSIVDSGQSVQRSADLVEKIVSSTGAASCTVTASASGSYVGAIVTIKPGSITIFQEEGNDFRETKFGAAWTTQ